MLLIANVLYYVIHISFSISIFLQQLYIIIDIIFLMLLRMIFYIIPYIFRNPLFCLYISVYISSWFIIFFLYSLFCYTSPFSLHISDLAYGVLFVRQVMYFCFLICICIFSSSLIFSFVIFFVTLWFQSCMNILHCVLLGISSSKLSCFKDKLILFSYIFLV